VLGDRSSRLAERFSRAGERFSELDERSPTLGERFSRPGERSPRLGERFSRPGERSPRVGERFSKLGERSLIASYRAIQPRDCVFHFADQDFIYPHRVPPRGALKSAFGAGSFSKVRQKFSDKSRVP
jgi:hypothetical protein